MNYFDYDKVLTRILTNNREYITYFTENKLSYESQEKIITLRLKEIAVTKSTVANIKKNKNKNNYPQELIDRCDEIVKAIDLLGSQFQESNNNTLLVPSNELCVIS